ncbi:MAG: hypothetical protein LBC83_04355 [Oscillospiraceae bacterium]|jgi:hypothetical protein|nr:hypothetical protein [Oscillospiraceae bacterium]
METSDFSNTVKVYVAVNEDRLADGTIRPRWITWEDGRRYEIDKVYGSCRLASRKAGAVNCCVNCGSHSFTHDLLRKSPACAIKCA